MTRFLLLISLLLGLTLAGCTALSSLSDATVEKAETSGVDVTGIPSLVVNHFAGNITVRNGEEGHITANLTKKSRLSDEAEAQAQLEQITMSFSQSGTDVTLDVDRPDSFAELVNSPSADLELLVPAGTVLAINLGAGDITVEEPEGDVTINTGAGNATVSLPGDASFRLAVTGGAVNVTSDFEGVPDGGVAANIEVAIGDAPAQAITLNIGAGEIRLEKAN